MEAATDFVLAAMRGARAGCLLVVDTPWRQDEPPHVGGAEEREATDCMVAVTSSALRPLDG